MATNRADTLDPALLRPGRLDRKIEFPVPDRRQKRLIFQVWNGGIAFVFLAYYFVEAWPALVDGQLSCGCKLMSVSELCLLNDTMTP